MGRREAEQAKGGEAGEADGEDNEEGSCLFGSEDLEQAEHLMIEVR